MQTVTDQQQAGPHHHVVFCPCEKWHIQKEVSHHQSKSLIAMSQSQRRLKVLECRPSTGRERTCLQDCGHSMNRKGKGVVNSMAVTAEKKSNHWKQKTEWEQT